MKKEIKVELHKVFCNRMFVAALVIGLVFVGLDWFDHYQFIKASGGNGGTSLYTKWIGVNGYTLGAWDKSIAIRFVPIVFVHFTGFKGEYWTVFNRKTREMGGSRRCKDGGGTFVPSS